MKAALAGLALSLGPTAEAQAQTLQIPSSEEAAEQLRRCGFAQVEVTYEEDLQEDALNLPDGTHATDEQISCAAKVSVETGYYVALADDLREQFWTSYGVISKEQSREIAKGWLSERGMLERTPHFDPAAMDASQFAGQLEKLCGPNASGAIGSQYGWHTFNFAWLDAGMAEAREDYAAREAPDDDPMVCLLNVAAFAGFDLGFVGNEKIAAPE